MLENKEVQKSWENKPTKFATKISVARKDNLQLELEMDKRYKSALWTLVVKWKAIQEELTEENAPLSNPLQHFEFWAATKRSSKMLNTSWNVGVCPQKPPNIDK